MKGILKILAYSGLLLCVQPSCVDPIDLPPPSDLTDAIVIQGRAVLGENSRVEMKVSRLFDFSAESKLSLNVRNVVFFDDQGNRMELEPVNQGEYNTPITSASPIQLEVGRSYGVSFSQISNINFGLTEEIVTAPSGELEAETRLETLVDTDISQGSNGMLWELDQTYRLTDSPIDGGTPKTCYITNAVTVNSIPTINLDNLISSTLNSKSIGVLPIDFRMAEGMYLTVKQFSLSEGAAQYWDNVATLVEREGDLFDDPVGLIPTNFVNPTDANDEVFGYFFASREVVSHIRVPESLVGQPVKACPPPPRPAAGSGCNLGICCDCLAGPSNTLDRPDFWID